MLVSSFEFIFIFLPITAAVFWLLVKARLRYAHSLGVAWLVLASLFFYAWWKPSNLWLILFSVLFNYLVGSFLNRESDALQRRQRQWVLSAGILVNLLLLGYFKYLNFFVDNINSLFGAGLNVDDKVLPLAISFFTFQQIGYLVDTYRQETKHYQFSEYLLFVSFFPQLIAGPIVHHKNLIPQFAKQNIARISAHNLAVGITIFSIGFFKKIIIADTIAQPANAMFSAAAGGALPDLFGSWMGALAYTFQLYFDFSGYSDMAIGAAYLFGIRLPVNFNSPYKAISISDFWRRWHITLSNFLRDYLYIPLGGNRKGIVRQNANLMITMLLGGLWHGAGWTFVIWGTLHGLYLVINSQWNALQKRTGIIFGAENRLIHGGAQLLTFLAVIVGWVFFRAQDISTATTILYSMVGGHGLSMPDGIAELLGPMKAVLVSWNVALTDESSKAFVATSVQIVVLLAVVWLAPNTQALVATYLPDPEASSQPIAAKTGRATAKRSESVRQRLGSHFKRPQWKPTAIHAIICGIMLFFSTKAMLAASTSEFLYFNF